MKTRTFHKGVLHAILFDMDGVLVASERVWDEELFAILKRGGVPKSVRPRLTGMSSRLMYKFLQQQEFFLSEAEFMRAMDNAADRVYERSPLMPYVREALSQLKGEYIFALVSSSPRRWIDLVLDRHNLRSLFRIVVSGDDVEGKAKPDPKIYLEALRRLHLPPASCLVIEDSANGVRAAKGAGIPCLGFKYPGNAQSLDEADRTFSNFEQLAETIRTLNL